MNTFADIKSLSAPHFLAMPVRLILVTFCLSIACPAAQIQFVPLECFSKVAMGAEPENGKKVTPVTATDRELQDIEARMIEKRAAIDGIRNELKLLERAKPEALPELTRALHIENETVHAAVPALRTARLQEAELLGAGLGAEHPRIKALHAQQKVYRTTLAEELESLRRAKKTELSLQEAHLKSLGKRKAEVEKRLQEKPAK